MDEVALAFRQVSEASSRGAATLDTLSRYMKKLSDTLFLASALEWAKRKNRALYRRYIKAKKWRHRKKAEKEILKLYDDMHVQALKKIYDDLQQVAVK